jgi:hypothetical protein
MSTQELLAGRDDVNNMVHGVTVRKISVNP